MNRTVRNFSAHTPAYGWPRDDCGQAARISSTPSQISGLKLSTVIHRYHALPLPLSDKACYEATRAAHCHFAYVNSIIRTFSRWK